MSPFCSCMLTGCADFSAFRQHVTSRRAAQFLCFCFYTYKTIFLISKICKHSFLFMHIPASLPFLILSYKVSTTTIQPFCDLVKTKRPISHELRDIRQTNGCLCMNFLTFSLSGTTLGCASRVRLHCGQHFLQLDYRTWQKVLQLLQFTMHMFNIQSPTSTFYVFHDSSKKLLNLTERLNSGQRVSSLKSSKGRTAKFRWSGEKVSLFRFFRSLSRRSGVDTVEWVSDLQVGPYALIWVDSLHEWPDRSCKLTATS